MKRIGKNRSRLKRYGIKMKTGLLSLLCLVIALSGCGMQTSDLSGVIEEVIEEAIVQEVEALEQEILGEEVQESETRESEVQEAENQEAEVQEEVQEPVKEESAVEEIEDEAAGAGETETTPEIELDKDGTYTTAEDVALYLYLYGELPSNFMTKKEARALGWPGGGLEEYAPGMCIGGDYFGNYEGLLPAKDGREYHECDIDTLGADSRGPKRIVFSDDGLIYYTEDHYESFVLLYGEE